MDNKLSDNYVLNTLLPNIKNHKIKMTNYDNIYLDCTVNGVYLMMTQNDIFVSLCDKNGMILRQGGQARRIKNCIDKAIYESVKSKAEYIDTDKLAQYAAKVGVI